MKFFWYLRLIMFTILANGVLMNVNAQQLPQSSHYLFHQLWLNPASAGSSDALQLDFSARGQWVKLEGSPVSQTLSLQMPVPALGAGLGINVANDQVGIERTTGLSLALSKVLFEGNLRWSAGLSLGIRQKYLDGSRLITPTGNYNDGIDHNDPLLSAQGLAAFSPDGSLGLYVSGERLIAGLAAQNVLALPFQFAGASEDLSIESRRHFLTYGSYRFDISYEWALRPHLLIKSDLQTHQAEFGLMGVYQSKWILSLGYRGYNKKTTDSFVGILAYRPSEKWTVVYSYDHTISSLGRIDIGSHEISATYRWANVIKTKNSKTTYNPRFL